MRKLTDFLITVYIMKGLSGRGPTAFGMMIAFSVPVGVLLVLISGLYPGGVGEFALRAFRTVLAGLH